MFGWSWRAIFWFNVFFGVIAVVSAAWVLPESSDPVRGRFDFGGFSSEPWRLGRLLLRSSWERRPGYRSWWIVVLFAFSICAALAFVITERRAANPILDVRYFKTPTFAGSNIIALTTYFGTFAIFFMVALYLQEVGEVSPLRLALDFIPLAVGMVVASLLTGRWVASWGPRIPMATGCALAGSRHSPYECQHLAPRRSGADRMDHVHRRGRCGHGYGAGDFGQPGQRSI